MTFTLGDGVNKHYFYGDFIAPAINLGLVSKVYMLALETLLSNRDNKYANRLCSVRLSSEFIKDPNSFESLGALFKEHAKRVSFELMFELSDNLVVKNPMLVQRFVELFRAYGYGFGINSFTGESDNFDYLRVLNPSFIKADVSFLLDQSKDSMSALELVTDSLGIRIIATFVRTQEELDALALLNITQVQGPITDSIK
jgi:EAL domain-containing protein (putative c-di-GMP-specific phosphodiesterase class I)